MPLNSTYSSRITRTGDYAVSAADDYVTFVIATDKVVTLPTASSCPPSNGQFQKLLINDPASTGKLTILTLNGDVVMGYKSLQPSQTLLLTSDGISVWFGLGGGSGGASGYSGYSGINGIIGQDGASGWSGYSGTSGFSGFSGTSGYTGAAGSAGASGFSGFTGASGWSGFSGRSGYSGYSGYSGPSGFTGVSGYSGFTGAVGNAGQSGFSGPTGGVGTSGFSGFSGSNPGASGYSGFSGTGGTSGFSGFSGTSGYSGFSGVAPTYARVTGADVTTTGQALVNITGLSIPLAINAVYDFEAVLSVLTSAVTTGTRYGVNYSAAGATVEAQLIGSSTSTAAKSERINALNTQSGTYLTTSAQNGQILIKGIMTTGANAGNITISHLKVTSGTATCRINSFLRVNRIS